ncbi:MAG: gliding motility-associated C-terminal domain-containing protein [Bacteroidales bacterium]|nr:gliding motility-associated C-terminal domain-containing protein [Bacteroidales bacterium]
MKKIFSIIVLLSCMAAVSAQTILMNNSAQPNYSGCNFTIYDDGGLNGDYSNGMDVVINISSNDPNNGAVSINVDMLSFDVACGDTLFFYDGPVVADSMLLAYFTNCDSLQAVAITVAGTIRTDGSVTVRFKSDGSDVGGGFVLTTDCVRPCQRVEVEMDPALCTKLPHLEADGYYYLDVCPADNPVHLGARGVYPDNDFSYHQDDAHSVFHWDFGWETLDSLAGNSVYRDFPEGRGYDVAISITDSAGCFSYVPQTFRVRTSSNPIREVLDFPQVCAGTEVDLTVGYDHLSIVQADTVGSQQITALSVNDTIFLPDGEDCGSGCAYVSPVTFTSFSPTATIQSPNDIWFVRVKMEHSYIGDIWIALTCPNGQFVSLVRKYQSPGSSNCTSAIPQSEWGWLSSGTSSADFGIVGPSNSSPKCDPNVNPMGTPWNYVWSNNTVNGYQYSAGNYVYASSNVSGSSMDSTNVAAMTNVFHPEGSFSNLIGCPMNGTWSINVVDGWGVDNGWLTEWEISLDPQLLPQDWSYEVLIDSTWVVGPGANGPQVIPDSAGRIPYTIYVMDEMGCVYDTMNYMDVVGHPEPHLGDDYKICYGDITVLSANYDQAGAEGQTTEYYWNTGDQTDSIEVLTAGRYYVNIITTSNETGLACEGSDTINIDIFERPVINVEDLDLSGCAPLNLRIENNSTPEGSSYVWYIIEYDDYGGSRVAFSSTDEDPVFQINEPGTYSLIMKMTTPDGCKDSIAMYNAIVVNPQPIAEFEADPAISMLSENGGVVNFINYADQDMVTGGAGSFYWDFDDGTIDSVNFAEPHTFASWGDYNVTLHVESNSGCSSEITHTIVIESDLIFPNVITPNGDGINDVWAIENLNTNVNPEDPDGYRNNRLQIFDRWGKKVYDAKNYDTYAKDGTVYPGQQIFNGEGLSDGVYYYSFHYKGKAKTITFNGSITIVR